MIYDYTLRTGKGGLQRLADYRGKVILVVNTATGCGFTPQYEPLEKLYRDYHDQGLEIVDVPCNQFGGQAPGSDDEIHEFCTLHYNTTFPQMKKADVNGEHELPLYTYLKSQKGFEGFDEHPYKALLEKMFSEADPDWASKPDIKWNFTKFVVDRNGQVVARFEPTADMADVEACVKELLKQTPEKKPAITKDMSIGQVLEIDRTTAPIMMEYGMHCMGCPFSQMESLEMGCQAHGMDVNELVDKLNAYIASRN